jgi:endonuclease-3 related protein
LQEVGGPKRNAIRVDAAQVLRDVYDRLWSAYGPQHWWPAETATEVVVGAILTQNTVWRNVERAIEDLKRADCITWDALRKIPQARLAALIQPSGTYRVKAARLKAFVNYLWDHHGRSLDSLLDGDLEDARRRLLSIHGIGPETADSILLYAGKRPTFVVDAYTRRVLRRHFVIDGRAKYEAVRRLFHDALPGDVRVYNEYHALFVALGKRHCRARAMCDSCPLVDLPRDRNG